MNTAFRLITYMPTPGGLTGAPRRLLTLANALGNSEIDVCVASQDGSKLIEAASEHGNSTASVNARGVLALRQGALFGGGCWFKLRVGVALLGHNLQFWHCIRRQKGDVVWIRGSKGIGFAALGTILSRRPLVWDVDCELPSKGVVRMLHRLGLWAAQAVVFQYENAAHEIFGEALTRRHRDKFQTIIPGVDLCRLEEHEEQRRARERRTDKSFRIIQVGTLCDRKNQRLIVEALQLLDLRHINRDVMIQFAGGVFEDEYALELKQAAVTSGLKDNLEFLGWRDDVHGLIADADLLVMPSKAEGVPNAVQEAMYLGIPVMVSEAGGMPEVVQDGVTGWVLPMDEPAAWAERIQRCIEHPDLGSDIGTTASRYAADYFGTDEWGARYASVIRDVLGSGTRKTNQSIRE